MDNLKNRIWITGKELMERWQISEMDFREYLMKQYKYKVIPEWWEPPLGFNPDMDELDKSEWDDRLGYLPAWDPDGSKIILRDSFSLKELGIKPEYLQDIPDEKIRWQENKKREEEINQATGMYAFRKFTFKVEDVLEFEKQLIPSKTILIDDKERAELERLRTEIKELTETRKDLDGNEHRELGRLRQEKEKWNASREAGIHAALFCQKKGGNVKRKELWNELFQFGIPEDAMRKIWNVLRQKKLTKGPGRPPNSTK